LRSPAWWWWPVPPLEPVGQSNKGGGPRVSLVRRQRFACYMLLLNRSECQVSEGSVGKLHWATQAQRLLDWKGFGRAHPCFFSDHLVPEGVWRSFVVCCHHETRHTVHGEVRDEV
jgi:hypothetical protein